MAYQTNELNKFKTTLFHPDVFLHLKEHENCYKLASEKCVFIALAILK